MVVLTSLIEIRGLLLVVIVSGDEIAHQKILWGAFVPVFDQAHLTFVVSGVFFAFFAFIGFEDMLNMVEEVKNPERKLPLGIAIALVTTGLLYGAVAITALMTLPLEELSNSEAPLALLIEHNSNIPVAIMAVINMAAIINGALIQIIMISRVLYGMAKRNFAPSLLDSVSFKTRTSITATLITGTLIVIFAL